MAPVIRISDTNWSRLKVWAEPLEDSADGALTKVFAAAEEHRNCPTQGQGSNGSKGTPDTILVPGDENTMDTLNKESENGDIESQQVPEMIFCPADEGSMEPETESNITDNTVRTNRLPRVNAVPRDAFERPILESLHELGGRAPVKTVVSRVEQRVKHLLGDADYEVVNGSIPRWKKSADWTKQALVNRGLLKPPAESGRGIWALTERGITEVGKRSQ